MEGAHDRTAVTMGGRRHVLQLLRTTLFRVQQCVAEAKVRRDSAIFVVVVVSTASPYVRKPLVVYSQAYGQTVL